MSPLTNVARHPDYGHGAVGKALTSDFGLLPGVESGLILDDIRHATHKPRRLLRASSFLSGRGSTSIVFAVNVLTFTQIDVFRTNEGKPLFVVVDVPLTGL